MFLKLCMNSPQKPPSFTLEQCFRYQNDGSNPNQMKNRLTVICYGLMDD
jgi:hypothetical protein